MAQLPPKNKFKRYALCLVELELESYSSVISGELKLKDNVSN